MIRILHIGMSPNYGGTEAFLMTLYRNVDRNKIQFDFLNVYDTQIACQDEIIEMGGRIYNLSILRKKSPLTYLYKLNTFFRDIAKKIDAVHIHAQSLVNSELLFFAKINNIKVRIIHAHNAGYGVKPNIIQSLIIRANKYLIKYLATDFFSCSSLAANWMFARNARIIKNAIDIEKFKFNDADRTSIRSEYKINKKKLILSVARLDPQKNSLYLIEIFSTLCEIDNDFVLFIAGDGVLKTTISNLIKEKGLEDKVVLLGNRTDINKIMSAADLFLLPSRFEGLGIVLIEAQCNGLPCVCSKDVIPHEVAVTDILSFVSLQDSIHTWKNAIIRTLGKKSIDRLLYANVVREAGYDAEMNSKQIANIYNNLIYENK